MFIQNNNFYKTFGRTIALLSPGCSPDKNSCLFVDKLMNAWENKTNCKNVNPGEY